MRRLGKRGGSEDRRASAEKRDPATSVVQLAVSPGRQGLSYLRMLGGHADHPMFPHYRTSHDSWASGNTSNPLPGRTSSVLALVKADY